MAGDDTDQFDPTQFSFDDKPSEVQDADYPATAVSVLQSAPDPKKKERIAVIRTTDRMIFRRCRRRWGWSSHLRGNLGMKEAAGPLWTGSGFHFALEDFHGKNVFGHPATAFAEFVSATRRHNPDGVPPNFQELHELADGMLKYYADDWLVQRDPLTTFVYNGIPQCEVNFRVEIPFPNKPLLEEWGYDRVVYSGTLDRVIIDDLGQLWIVEYKTAKSIQTLHLSNDSQVTSYVWAAKHLYPGYNIAGVIYQQHRKDLPHEPKILASGRLSLAKDQLITHRSLRAYIRNIYGEVKLAPPDYTSLLNMYAKEEGERYDKFVRRDYIPRNDHQCEAEGVKILMETEEMLNPDLPMYPNPTRDCQFMCSFNGPCVSLDDGGDWEYEMDLLTQTREAVYDSWRSKVRLPGETGQEQIFLEKPSQIRNIIDHIPGENNG